MTGKNSPEDVTPEERQMAKPCNFGLLYRMGNRGFYNYLRAGYQPDITFEEACDLRAQFFEGYPDLAAGRTTTLDAAGNKASPRHVRSALALGMAGAGPRTIWTKMKPSTATSSSGFNGAYAINHPVQGSSAEVMMIALTQLDKVLRDEPAQLIATVHDEAVLLVPDDLAALERIGAVAQQEMIAAFLEVFPDAPTLTC